MNHVVDVIPEVVVVSDVLLEASSFIESHTAKVTNEANIYFIVQSCSFFISHLGKRIDNDSEQYIEQNNLYDNVETSVMNKFEEVLLSSIQIMNGLRNIAYTTTKSQSLV